MSTIRLIVLLLLVCIPAQSFAGSAETNKWSQAPRDVYFHIGGSAICSAVLVSALTEKKISFPKLKSASFCFALGLVKEFLIDDKPSEREAGLNAIGVTLGVFTF